MAETVQTRARAGTSGFERLAGWAYRRRWWAVAAWLAILVGVTLAGRAVGADYHNDFSLPGTESQAALDTLRERSPVQAGTTVQVVLADPDGLAAAGTERRVEDMLDRVRALPHVADVRSPYDDPAAVSRDGTVGYATVTLDGQAQDVPAEDVRTIVDTARSSAGDGLRVELGGEAVRGAQESGGGPAEGVGLLAALVILVLLFGSALAASLPIVVAVFAVGSAIGLLVLASHAATVADFTTPLMVLVGLGVGIDYALLLFSRYRAELLRGATSEDAGRRAVDTAGRTVFFAGCTVIIALLGLVVLGLGSLQGVAVAVALTVLATMAASLTLLPALLALMGRRLERAVRRRAARRRRPDGERWRRWAASDQRRPWTLALAAVAALLAL
ncbi:MAG TPA: MMPL family transporter, partial [Micromonosporaceae bacterium]